jgi:pimeloyl-ACP methyl ester carboxylesterase
MDREIFAKDTETRGAAAVIDRMLPKFLTGESEIDQVSRESQLREWIEPADPMALATALRAMAARQDSRDILKQISIPTLVIAGESDPLIALDEMRSMASSIPNAQFNLMEKTGHLAPVDQSEQWAKLVVAFIEKTL